MNNLYHQLGVSTDADSEALKQAAEQRLKTLKQAYKILSSQQKREVYDARYAQQEDNFYDLLQVSSSADTAIIKQAVQQQVNQVKQAYAVLGHPEKRAAYDAQQNDSALSSQEDSPMNPPEAPVVDSTPAPPVKQSSLLGRFFKYAAITISVLLVLIVLLVLGLYWWVNPNDYKPQIEKLVQEQTGREFKLEGDLKLSLFPWAGLELNQVHLGNAPGFEDPIFAKIDNLQAKVKLLPLLSKQVEMDTLTLIGADIRLTRLADGRTNWDDLVAKSTTPAAPESNETPSAGFDPSQLHIGGINVQNAALHWDDQQQQQSITLSNTRLSIGEVALPNPIQVELEAQIEASQPSPSQLKLTFASQVQFNPATGQLELRDLNWNSHVKSALVPQGEQTLAFKLQQLSFNQTTQSLTIKELALSALGMTVRTDFDAQKLLTAPDISGHVALETFNPRTVLTHLGQANALPDSKFLQTAGLDLNFNVQMGAGAVLVHDVEMKVDENHIKVPQLQWNMQSQTLQMEALQLQFADLSAQARVEIKNLLGVMQLEGDLQVQNFNPKALMAQLGLPALETQDAQALTKVALQTQLSGDLGTIKLDNFQLTLDDSQLAGHAQLQSAKQAFAFDLVLDQLNLDRYLPPPSPPTTAPAAATKPPELAFESLRTLNLDGKLAIHHLHVQQQSLENINIGVFAEQGQIKLSSDLEYQVFKSTSRVVLDASQEPAQLTFNQEIQHQQNSDSTMSLQSHLTLHKNLQFAGDASLSINKLRELAGSLQLPIPSMQDNTTLQTVTLNLKDLQGDTQNLDIKQLQLTLDDTQADGHLKVQNFSQPAVNFDLHIDNINVDRYLPPPSDVAPPPTPGAVEQQLPLEALRQLNITGQLLLDKVQVSSLHLQNLKLEVQGKDGDIHLKQSVNLYQGQLQADAHLDARQTPVKLTVKKQLSGVQTEPMFNDLQAGKGLLKGQANFGVNLSGSFERPQDLLKSLSGDVQFDFKEGALKGFNLEDAIASAKALAKGKMPSPGTGPAETAFSELKGSLKMQDGNLHTDDIHLQAPYLNFKGSGDVALAAQTLDYHLDVTVLDKATVDAGKTSSGIVLPVTLKGSLTKPKINVDIKALFAGEAERQLNKQLEKHGDELKEKAFNKLRGLF